MTSAKEDEVLPIPWQCVRKRDNDQEAYLVHINAGQEGCEEDAQEQGEWYCVNNMAWYLCQRAYPSSSKGPSLTQTHIRVPC